jgi:hypothetical protein
VGYIMEKYDHPRDIAPIARDLEDMNLEQHEPPDPATDASTTRIQMHREKVKRHLNKWRHSKTTK